MFWILVIVITSVFTMSPRAAQVIDASTNLTWRLPANRLPANRIQVAGTIRDVFVASGSRGGCERDRGRGAVHRDGCGLRRETRRGRQGVGVLLRRRRIEPGRAHG